MTPNELALAEALRGAVAGAGDLREVRLAAKGRPAEVPLSRLPAALIEPAGLEALTWPDVPVGAYHLAHWRVTVLDRALPGTRAFEALVQTADAARAAVLATGSLGGLAEDGPPSRRAADLAPPVGAVRAGPATLGDSAPGHPTAVTVPVAAGWWAETQAGGAELDGEALFASGPHVVEAGSPGRRVDEVRFGGLDGGLLVDLGEAARPLVQTGVLSASTEAGLAVLEAAIEAFIDGRLYTLTAPGGAVYANVRVEAFERLGPPRAGLDRHRPYRVVYRQFGR